MNDKSEHPPGDVELTAFLDGELSGEQRTSVQEWLNEDDDVRARLSRLASGGRPFREAFDLLTEGVPYSRLEGMLASIDRSKPVAARRWQVSLLAGAAVIAAFVLGVVVDRLVLPAPTTGIEQREAVSENWRQAVAEYFGLNTADTLAAVPDDDAARVRELKAVGDRLNLSLTMPRLALSGLTLKRADLFSFDGHPLAEVLYLDPQDGPVALCIIANGAPDTAITTERREDRNVVFWQSRGRGFLLIGRTAPGKLRQRAETIAARFSS